MKKIMKFIPSIMVLIILGIVYYINGLYPFGNNPLVQVDADFQYIPMLYKMYDIFRGSGNVFFDFIGLGNSLYGSLIVQGSLFSPINILLLFVRRSNIVNFMGLFIMIKICLLAYTSYFYIDKRYKVNYFYKILFSILYSFNGFVLLNYFNDMWLDVVILFPLLIYYLEELLNNQKYVLYTLILALSLIISVYFSLFVVIFIIFYSFIYLNIISKKEDVKKSIFLLGKATVIAFLISSFSTVPCLYQILTSGRFSSTGTTGILSNIMLKSLHILMSPLFIILFFKLIFKYKSNKKVIYSYIVTLILYLIPLFVDPINVQMHFGGFWSFPYRYSFITCFILMNGSLFYLSKYDKKCEFKLNIKNIIYVLFIFLFGALGVYLNSLHLAEIIDEGILLEISKKFYLYIICVILIVFVMYVISLFIKNNITKYVMIGFISVYSIFLFSSWTIYYNKGYFLCTNAMDVYNNMENIPKDGRYKVEYETYSPEFGFILGVETLDNWLHILPDHMVDFYKMLGYHTSGTTINSYGGTIFSDYLLDFKYIFSNSYKDDDMYTLIDSYDNKYLYRYNYNNSGGIKLNGSNILVDESFNKFEYQNNIYKSLYDTSEDIITYDTYTFEEGNSSNCEYNVNHDSYFYFMTDNYSTIEYLSVNGNNFYPGDEFDAIYNLGLYNGNVKFEVHLKDETSYFIYDIGYIEKDKITTLNSNVNSNNNTYYVNSENETSYLFIPINNIKGLKVYNNHKLVNSDKYLSNFVLVKLNKGDNLISFGYDMPMYNISIILTLIGIILFILSKYINGNKLVLNISFYVYYGLVILVYFYFYLLSLFKFGG